MKKLLSITLSFIFVVFLAACSSSSDAERGTVSVDKDKAEISFPAQVNGKYFTESTRHGIVDQKGSNGEKSVLRGLVSAEDVHQGLMDIGATPGNNLTMEDMGVKDSSAGKSVEGDPIDVYLIWDGQDKEVKWDDVIKASDKRPTDIRFGGNLENAKDKQTGCILCLDSCAVGITSNKSYPAGVSQGNEVQFYGNEDVLPEDGTTVTVIFRLAK